MRRPQFLPVPGDRNGGCVKSVLSFRGPCQGAFKAAPLCSSSGLGIPVASHVTSLLSVVLLVGSYFKWMNMEGTTLSSLRFTSSSRLCKLDTFTRCIPHLHFKKHSCSTLAHFQHFASLFTGISVWILNVSLSLDMCS